MFKFVQKHKYFMICFFALMVLTLGFFLAKPSNKETYDSKAATYSFTITYRAYWSNTPDGAWNTGNYVSQDGNVLQGAVGYIEKMPTTTCSNGSISGGEASFSDGGAKTVKFSITHANFWWGTNWSYSIDVAGFASRLGFQCKEMNGMNFYGEGRTSKLFGGGSDYDEFTLNFYPITYSIGFNANGGYFPNGATYTYVDTTYYENYNLPSVVPTREGYTFAGWATSSSGGSEVTQNTCFSEVYRRTIYAKWTPNTYTINFDANGGQGGTGNKSVEFDSICPSISVPTRKGYTFEGYYSWDNELYYDGFGNSNRRYKTASNMTLYAKWSANNYKVSIDSNGGTLQDLKGWNRENGQIYKYTTYDSRYNTLPIFTKTGNTFSHYSYNGQVVDANSILQTDFDHTLLANWREHTYTIKFNAGGGYGNMADLTGIAYSQNKTLPTNSFVRDGYTFKGWATSSGGEVTYENKAKIRYLTAEDEGVVHLYAVWENTWASMAVKPVGLGTQESPYLIKSAENLAWVAKETNKTASFTGYFRQEANIDLAGLPWLPIGDQNSSFSGIFNGNNYVITNLTTAQTLNADGTYANSYVGLFGNVAQGLIERINLQSGVVYGNQNVGSIVGQASADSKILHCQSYATVIGNSKVGGLVGRISVGTIENCYSKASVSANASFVGGIVGEAVSSQINSCGFEGCVSATKGALIAGSTTGGNIKDSFADVERDCKFYYGTATVEDCLYSAGLTKAFFAGDFDNWVVSTTKMPLPGGLSWLATVAVKVDNVEKLIELGYSRV